MKRIMVLMVLMVALPCFATLSTVTATLYVSNADGTFPTDIPDVTCSVTYISSPNPTPIIYSPTPTYTNTTGAIVWTVPQNSYIKVGCKACYGFTTPSNYAIATSNVILNDMVASTPPSISSVNSFATIDCPSGTDPVADTAIDTLTFTAGTGLTITGDSTADSVTFANTATLENVTTNGATTAADITMQVGAATLYEPYDTGGSMFPLSYSIDCVRSDTGPEGDLKYLNIDPVAATVPPHQIGRYGMYSGSFYAYRTTEWPGKIGILKNDTIAGESLFLANPFAVSGTAYTFNTYANLAAGDKIADFRDHGTSVLYLTGSGDGVASGSWTFAGSVSADSGTFDHGVTIGNSDGDGGALSFHSMPFVTDYVVTLAANVSTTSNAAFYLPADEPTGESFLKMGTDGVMDYDDSTYLTGEVDGVVGNEVTDTNGTTLTRSGTGTSGDPYKLALNLGNANTWTVNQTAPYFITSTTYNPDAPRPYGWPMTAANADDMEMNAGTGTAGWTYHDISGSGADTLATYKGYDLISEGGATAGEALETYGGITLATALTGDFDIAAKVALPATVSGRTGIFIGTDNTATGDGYAVFGNTVLGQPTVYYGAFADYAAAATTTALADKVEHPYLRITRSGTDLSFSASADGISWYLVATTADPAAPSVTTYAVVGVYVKLAAQTAPEVATTNVDWIRIK